MEALTAAAVAALTVYDMCKAADHGIEISELRLLEKSGGRSGTYRAKARRAVRTKVQVSGGSAMLALKIEIRSVRFLLTFRNPDFAMS